MKDNFIFVISRWYSIVFSFFLAIALIENKIIILIMLGLLWFIILEIDLYYRK